MCLIIILSNIREVSFVYNSLWKTKVQLTWKAKQILYSAIKSIELVVVDIFFIINFDSFVLQSYF
jgi:hypothetical protein